MNQRIQSGNFPLLMFVAIFTLGVLHMGTIRKKEDPIRDTQTDPIAYDQKMEEIKDGEKGPATPTFQFYEKEEFMTEPPADKQVSEKTKEALSGNNYGVFEKEEPYKRWDQRDPQAEETETDDDWWLEEWDEEDLQKTGEEDES